MQISLENNSINEYENNSTNISTNSDIKVGETGAANIPNTSVSDKSGITSLQAGDLFDAGISDIVGHEIKIILGNGEILKAKLQDNISFNIGDDVTFLVKNNIEGHIEIKPIQSDMSNGNMSTMIKALESANVQVNATNIKMVEELMVQGQAINKDILLDMVKLSNKFPNAGSESIVALHKFDMPVTEENIQQFNAYKEYNSNISSIINDISQDLTSVVIDRIKADVEQISMNQTSKVLVNINGESTNLTDSNQTNQLDINTKEMTIASLPTKMPVTDLLAKIYNIFNSDSIQENVANRTDDHFNNNVKNNIKNDINSILELIKNNKIPDNQSISELIDKTVSELIDKTVRKLITNNWRINAEELLASPNKKEQISSLFLRIRNQTEQLMKLSNTLGKSESKLSTDLSNMKNNMNFMNDMNNFASYTQIPIKFASKETNSELYVLNKMKGKTVEGQAITAFLHLDMDNLGATDVHISLKGQHVNTKFVLDNDEAMDIVEKHFSELQKHLEDKRFIVEYSVEELNKKEPSKTIFEKIFEIDEKTKVKRYSFDVRA